MQKIEATAADKAQPLNPKPFNTLYSLSPRKPYSLNHRTWQDRGDSRKKTDTSGAADQAEP